MNDTSEIIILAAGKGTRMESEVPKVLVPLGGIEMIHHVLSAVKKTGITDPIVVIGYEAQMVKDACGEHCRYVLQDEQKGTGHAVLVTEPEIKQESHTIVVIYGDQPFVSTETIELLASPVAKKEAKIVLATSVIQDDILFEKQFSRFGRIIRNNEGGIEKIVEAKDATEQELAVREVNVGFMSFDKQWGFKHLSELKNDNAQDEYYLTTLVEIAFEEGLDIASVQISEKEALGANTKEQLELMHEHLES